MPLELKKQTAKVAHLNVREEKHGEESVLAVDVKVQADVANDFLDRLSPGLRQSLYAPDGEQLEGVEQPMSILRFPQMKPIDWDAPIVMGELVLHGARKADVKKPLVLACKEGGTVELTFQAAVLPGTDQMGPLSELLGKSTKVSVRSVEQPSQPPLE